MPLSVIVGNKIKEINLIKQIHTDTRIKMMNEILSGVKIIKFYGWEVSFQNWIGRIRNQELKYLKKTGILSVTTSFLWTCAPYFVAIVSFGSYIALNGSRDFKANLVFVGLNLFNIMKFPLTVLPTVISSLISVKQTKNKPK